MNLDQLLQESVQRAPSHPAILASCTDQQLTYGELDSAIAQRAAELQNGGVEPGDAVGLHVPSGVEYIICTYAIWRCGACVVPIPIELAPDEKRQILQEIHLHAVISDPRELAFAAPFSAGHATDLSAGHSLLKVKTPQLVPTGFDAINPAFIRFTSGTTGDFKGVVLSHQTILERIQAANDVLKLGPDDRVVWLLSMSYHFAVSIVGYLTFGSTILLPENLFAPAILQIAEEHRGTFMYGSPLHYSWMVDCKNDVRLDSLRMAVSTTCALKQSLSEAFQQRFGLPLTQALGIIEVGLPCINVDFAATNPEAIGRVLPAYEVKLSPSVVGDSFHELQLKGPGFLDAYYHPWRTRHQIMPDGWFATGDICSIDDQGCITLQGRSKDIINISGMKFFPQETETVLSRHPGILAARIFPVHHPRWGELARAEVIAAPDVDPLPTPAELSVWCRQHLAPYKIPTDFEYVEDFPRTASGKVLHRSQ